MKLTDQNNSNFHLKTLNGDIEVESLSDFEMSENEGDITNRIKEHENANETTKVNDADSLKTEEKNGSEEDDKKETEEKNESEEDDKKETEGKNESEEDDKKETEGKNFDNIGQSANNVKSTDEKMIEQLPTENVTETQNHVPARPPDVTPPPLPVIAPPPPPPVVVSLPTQSEPVVVESKEVPSEENDLPVDPDVTENFWIDGNYRKIVRRIEDSSKILDDLAKMIHERAEIENLYASKLKAWQKKWFDISSKSFEYGSIFTSVMEGLKEAESLADLHVSVYSRLEDLSKSIQEWRSGAYPKTITTKIKEAKRSEEMFSKAQKPWVIKFNEANKCMKAYHAANHMLELGEAEVKTSTGITPEQKQKLDAKVIKCKQDIIVTREKYEEALRDISNYNPKYKDDMQYEFGKCQKFEEARRIFMKEKLLSLHACLDRTIFIENYKFIYADLDSKYQYINIEHDLKWYQRMYGIDHPFITLKFIEYDPVLHKPHDNTTNGKQKSNISPPTKPKGSGVCTTL